MTSCKSVEEREIFPEIRFPFYVATSGRPQRAKHLKIHLQKGKKEESIYTGKNTTVTTDSKSSKLGV